METNFLLSSVEDFQFSKFYENDAKQGKRNSEISQTVTFEVKNFLQNYNKSRRRILRTYFFVGK